jgi:hypothetical protein
VNLFLNPDLY